MQDSSAAPSNATVTARVLQALEVLDRHSFDRVDSSNSIDTVYAKIFTGSPLQKPNTGGTAGAATGTSEPLTVDQVRRSRFILRVLCHDAIIATTSREWFNKPTEY